MRVRVTDKISVDDAALWMPGSNILITSPMGSGKSYFCKNTLYSIAKEANGKILMLIHRSNCVEQFKYEIEIDGKVNVIEVRTYQALEYHKLHNTKNQIDLSKYQFIVCDEFHYFFEDSKFNNKTAVSFKMIMANKESVHVFMSATGDGMANYMKSYTKKNELPKPVEYKIPFDYSFIKKLNFFYKEETIEQILKNRIAKGEKGIFFIYKAEDAYKLYKKYKDYCVFNCSANNKTYYQYVDKEKIKNILINQRFEEQFLITTACFDAGINIIDREVKHIVLDIVDTGSLIQCIGRKRIQDDEDKVNVYIKAMNNQKLAGFKRSTEEKVQMAEYFQKNDCSVEKLIERYPMQNDLNNILYDDLAYDSNGEIIPNTYRKSINELMYFKKKNDIADYSTMMKSGKFGYCKYMANLLGAYDEKAGSYTYSMIKEDYELETYLARLVKEDTVFLQLKDRAELIKKINAKQDGKLLKKAATLNQVLEERELDFRIKEFETTRMIQDTNGEPKKKKYKNAWKIVKF